MAGIVLAACAVVLASVAVVFVLASFLCLCTCMSSTFSRPHRLCFCLHDLECAVHHVDKKKNNVLKRSAFGLTVVYNLLPVAVVESKAVSSFQSALQSAVRKAAHSNIDNWQSLFSPVTMPVRAVAFQKLFEG